VKNVLIPSAQSKDPKQLLTDTVPTLDGHLQHAKNVQAQVGANAAKKWALPHGGEGGATLPHTPHRCAAESGALPPRSARADREEGAGGRDDRTCLICPSAHDVTSGFFLRRLAPELADVISQAVFHITRSVKSPLH
jgi:hypothetical protein